jgi:hypothetical protein
MGDKANRVTGWPVVENGRFSKRSTLLRVGDARAGTTRAEVSPPDRQFADVQHESSLLVEGISSADDVLGRRVILADRPTIVTFDQALPEGDGSRSVLRTGAAADPGGPVAYLDAERVGDRG